MHDTGIATRLRAAGLTVVEVAGWQTRGAAGFDPRGSVDHHTAGPRSGNAPSLSTCIYGRSDLPGPLCHVLVGRDNTCYVIAAGRANHAGSGGWRGLSGNSSVWGVERESVGTTAEPWRPDQTSAASAVHAALIRGRATHEMVCGHKEWTSRKVDPHTLNMHNFRAMVAQRLGTPPAPPAPTAPAPPQEDDMYLFRVSDGPKAGTIFSLSGGKVLSVDGGSVDALIARLGQPIAITGWAAAAWGV